MVIRSITNNLQNNFDALMVEKSSNLVKLNFELIILFTISDIYLIYSRECTFQYEVIKQISIYSQSLLIK